MALRSCPVSLGIDGTSSQLIRALQCNLKMSTPALTIQQVLAPNLMKHRKVRLVVLLNETAKVARRSIEGEGAALQSHLRTKTRTRKDGTTITHANAAEAATAEGRNTAADMFKKVVVEITKSKHKLLTKGLDIKIVGTPTTRSIEDVNPLLKV